MGEVPGIGASRVLALRYGMTGVFSLRIGTGGSNDREK
ncbi:hypothetical protein NSPZN2_50292 [Nitrospira defluvii]|uniref:Uncharacterized protein n=1 Tax=Nitrospira defluvii TaxID=330214 RepID=A0ABM8S5D7_9BACT|nr:hypothetical protein NSPZN2_50292 [Nitrospira defluvii]